MASLVTHGAQQPYYILECGSSKTRSKCSLDDGRNPIWSMAHKFDITFETEAKLIVKDEITKGIIGECTVDLTHVRALGKESQKIRLTTMGGRKQGTILLKLKYQPADGKAFDKVPAKAEIKSTLDMPIDSSSEKSLDMASTNSMPSPLSSQPPTAAAPTLSKRIQSTAPVDSAGAPPLSPATKTAARAPEIDQDDLEAEAELLNIESKYSQARLALQQLTAELADMTEDTARPAAPERAVHSVEPPEETPSARVLRSNLTMPSHGSAGNMSGGASSLAGSRSISISNFETAPEMSSAAAAAAAFAANSATNSVIVQLKVDKVRLEEDKRDLESQLVQMRRQISTLSAQHYSEVQQIKRGSSSGPSRNPSSTGPQPSPGSASSATTPGGKRDSANTGGLQLEDVRAAVQAGDQASLEALVRERDELAAALAESRKEVAGGAAEVTRVKSALLGAVQDKAELEEALGLMEQSNQAELAALSDKLTSLQAAQAEMSRRHDDEVEGLRGQLADAKSNLTAMEGSNEEVSYLQGQLRRAWQQVIQLQHQVQVLETGRGPLDNNMGSRTDAAPVKGEQLDALANENEFLMAELVATKLEVAQLKEREVVYQRQMFKAQSSKTMLLDMSVSLEAEAH